MPVKQKAKLIIAAAVLIISGLIYYASLGGFGPPLDLTAHKASGKILAAEALKLRGSGGKILVISQDTSGERNPYADAQFRAFNNALRKNGASISTNRTLRLNSIRLITVPATEFIALFKKSTENDVIVSLLGPPILAEAQIANLPEKRAKILAYCPGSIPRQLNLRRAFDQSIVTAAVISRPDGSRIGGNTPLETFNRSFSVITAANLSELPMVASSNVPR
jgi:hypothetical protein